MCKYTAVPGPDGGASVFRRRRGRGAGSALWRQDLCPCGRTLDTFDAEIIVDASAHQTCCQICRNEGDLVLYRKAGADLSDGDTLGSEDGLRPIAL